MSTETKAVALIEPSVGFAASNIRKVLKQQDPNLKGKALTSKINEHLAANQAMGYAVLNEAGRQGYTLVKCVKASNGNISTLLSPPKGAAIKNVNDKLAKENEALRAELEALKAQVVG